eukprot:2547295-Rhodomonas_salina.1
MSRGTKLCHVCSSNGTRPGTVGPGLAGLTLPLSRATTVTWPRSTAHVRTRARVPGYPSLRPGHYEELSAIAE